ncbi:MAG: AMP-binding protein [Phenylobacterium sp.]|uniref:AMP-binding protein n=1 Tax=Phenylobacterium sp. TaxID=1871053 RepID=UPI0027372C98|nr:AMP-binding protein [Phenylobacterium sp.]MDP3174149.1 AMP-binding protein [Phenylobacterium sp.]
MYTVFSTFAAVAAGSHVRPFICIPPRDDRSWLPEGAEFTFGEVLRRVLQLRSDYAGAGYGHGHRAALLLENRPDFLFHFLALNSLGASIVPINPDLVPAEIAYILEHSEADLVVGLSSRLDALRHAARGVPKRPPVADAELWKEAPPVQGRTFLKGSPTDESEAAILYTSGTTGQPKGCVLTNRAMLATARSYVAAGGSITFFAGQDRLISPLPLFHVGGLCLTTLGMMVSGNCIILLERFRPSQFWRDAVAARATVMHYLGVVPAMLMSQPDTPDEHAHSIRFGLGGGASPSLIERFRHRFGIALTEGWSMTEVGRCTWNNYASHHTAQPCIGRSSDGLEARVVDEHDDEVPHGTIGELCVRWAGLEGPRWGFFAGYLKDPQATESGWRGGWWHTGDAVTMEDDGTLIFIDRRKNIIRRSGENIAAAEVEQMLASHPAVAQAAVVAVADEIREEEVLACVVLKDGVQGDLATARLLFDHCGENLAYFKVPGWVLFMSEIPTTGSQKVAKSQLFPGNADPRTYAGIHDLRVLKRRGQS